MLWEFGTNSVQLRERKNGFLVPKRHRMKHLDYLSFLLESRRSVVQNHSPRPPFLGRGRGRTDSELVSGRVGEAGEGQDKQRRKKLRELTERINRDMVRAAREGLIRRGVYGGSGGSGVVKSTLL